MHQAMAAALEQMLQEIRTIQKNARNGSPDGNNVEHPRWPLLILKTPKGWTGPKKVDGKPVEGTWRAHQVPIT
jgi:xylulose-5-phosphate/fructose-6-phosphate phosphoketolase